MFGVTRSIVADVKPDLVLARKLFNGPTLIRVAPPARSQSLFESIHSHVQPGSRFYARYIEAKEFAKGVYEDKYGGEDYVGQMSVTEPHDHNAVILYALGRNNCVVGTLRLCLDAGNGLPMADDVCGVLSTLRRQGQTIAEPGRFATAAGKRVSGCLISAAYEVACAAGITVYLMQCRADHCDFYASHLAAEVLVNQPAPEGCVNMIWRVADTPAAFFNRFGRNRLELKRLLDK